jgi:hypothetical protein
MSNLETDPEEYFAEAAQREPLPRCPKDLNTGGSWGEDPLPCTPTIP